MFPRCLYLIVSLNLTRRALGWDGSYDIFHGHVEITGGLATQRYFIHNRDDKTRENRRARNRLRDQVIDAVQRRVPPQDGIRLEVQGTNPDLLPDVTKVINDAGLSVSSANLAEDGSHTVFFLTVPSGQWLDPAVVEHLRAAITDLHVSSWTATESPQAATVASSGVPQSPLGDSSSHGGRRSRASLDVQLHVSQSVPFDRSASLNRELLDSPRLLTLGSSYPPPLVRFPMQPWSTPGLGLGLGLG